MTTIGYSDLGDLLFQTILEKMAPFCDRSTLDVYTTYDIDYDRYRIEVRLGCFPENVYTGIIDRDMIHDFGREFFYKNFFEVVANYFGSIREPVPDNIQLGEN